MKRRKNLLDEMQEQKMLHIEHNGFWLAFFGLAIVIAIQYVAFPLEDLRSFLMVSGEMLILFLLSLYMVIASIKNGLWDRRLKANPKTNLLVSLAAGVVFAGINFAFSVRNFGVYPFIWASAIICGVSVFVLCFAGLSLCSALYRKRRRALEEQGEKESEEEN